MSNKDNRRYPRIHHVSSREMIHLDQEQNPKRHLVLTQNFSASGVRFATNENLQLGQFLLIYLNDQLIRDINKNHSQWLQSGDYYLTRTVWVRPSENSPQTFDVGVEFIEKQKCNPQDLETFTELMNVRMLEHVASTDRKPPTQQIS